jgi:hypothetical protein
MPLIVTTGLDPVGHDDVPVVNSPEVAM